MWIDNIGKLKVNERNLKKVPWIGPIPDIFQSIVDSLNITYSLQRPRDGNWGLMEDGQWNGMIKDLLDGVADVCASSIILTDFRAKYVDFSIPIIDEKFSFFISKETSSPYMIFLHPLSMEVWVTLLIVILISTFTFKFIIDVSRDDGRIEFSLVQCLTFVFGAFSGFGVRRWSITPSSIPGR